MRYSMIRYVVAALVAAGAARAETTKSASPANAGPVTLELRIAADASGCPQSLECWLLSSPDSIAGIEALLTWDRPDLFSFQRPDSLRFNSAAPVHRDDSATAPLRALSGTELRCDTSGGLLSEWEYVGASSPNLFTAKVTLLSQMIAQDSVVAKALPPLSRGLLFRLPLTAKPSVAGIVSRSDSAIVRFEPMGTFVANTRGELYNPVITRSTSATQEKCKGY